MKVAASEADALGKEPGNAEVDVRRTTGLGRSCTGVGCICLVRCSERAASRGMTSLLVDCCGGPGSVFLLSVLCLDVLLDRDLFL